MGGSQPGRFVAVQACAQGAVQVTLELNAAQRIPHVGFNRPVGKTGLRSDQLAFSAACRQVGLFAVQGAVERRPVGIELVGQGGGEQPAARGGGGLPLHLAGTLPVGGSGVVAAQRHGAGVVPGHACQGLDALHAAGDTQSVLQAPEAAQADRSFAVAPIEAVAHTVFIKNLRAVRKLGVDTGHRGVLRYRRIEVVGAIQAVDKVVAQVQLGRGVNRIVAAKSNLAPTAPVDGVFCQGEDIGLRHIGHGHRQLDARAGETGLRG